MLQSPSAKLPTAQGDDRRADLLARYERWTDIPLLALALAVIPLLLLPELLADDSSVLTFLDAADWLIWAGFAVDLAIRTWLAPRRLRYLISHWYDVLIVALPLLRPLRVLRSARLLILLRGTRVGVLVFRATATWRRVLTQNGLHVVLLAAVVVVGGCGALVTFFERDSGGPIHGLDDGLWFAATTVTTVGYGDMYPTTPEGRGVAVVLMLVGIALFGVVTANVAAYFVASNNREDNLTAKLDEVLARLQRLEDREHNERAERPNGQQQQ